MEYLNFKSGRRLTPGLNSRHAVRAGGGRRAGGGGRGADATRWRLVSEKAFTAAVRGRLNELVSLKG
ncbi:hypothetical protein EVAR_35645_1 [Eumeta japonica]|uniref:Uncharacterized protein n=1 Tax=Eumeta variegata TaxID=151549 RepID=A0A4C1WD97_EUMVA|nr:hypothetical protein EVAR_35645_1 [Eumeta japonica]